MLGKTEHYIEMHGLEFDLEHSDCNECYQKHLECQYYYGECRRVDKNHPDRSDKILFETPCIDYIITKEQFHKLKQKINEV